MKGRFVGLFLLSFTALLVVWVVLEVATAYRWAVLYTVRFLSPLLTGWWFEPVPPPSHQFPVFTSSGETIELVINPALLSFAQIPLLSLILATPGLPRKEMVVRCFTGVLVFFGLHVGVVLLYPFLLERPNLLKDSLGVFAGLLSFVLAPQLLWFVLTYRYLQPLWKLHEDAEERTR